MGCSDTGILVRKIFTGEQTGPLVDFCKAYEEKRGIGSLGNIRVTVQGKDREAAGAERRIQGRVLNYTKDGYIRNIAVEEDKTGLYFIVACSTAKFERIAAKTIVLEYGWEGDVSFLLTELQQADSEDKLLQILEDLEIGLPSEVSSPQLNQMLQILPKLVKSGTAVKKKAAAIVKQIRKPEMNQYLMELMRDDSSEVRQIAVMDAESLRDLLISPDTEKLKTLLNLNLSYPYDECTRIYAAEGLGFIGDADTINSLSDRKYDTPDVQWASIGAIATIMSRLESGEQSPERIRYESLIDFLVTAIADRSKKTVLRETAISALGHIMKAMIPYESVLRVQMEKAYDSLIGQVLHEESLLLRIAAVRELQNVTQSWKEHRNQLPLELSLSMLPDLLTALSSTLINPWRGAYCPIIDDLCKVETENKNQCFIIFRYEKRKKELQSWEEIITNAVRETGMVPLVARDLSKGEARGSHCTQICKPIRESRMCIADVSKESTSVGYEINLAWKYNRPVLITCEVGKPHSRKLVPFDLQGLQIAYYERLEDLKTEIPGKIRDILAMIEDKRLQ